MSLPGPLAGRGGLAKMDADLPQVFTQSGAEAPHYGGRHLGFLSEGRRLERRARSSGSSSCVY